MFSQVHIIIFGDSIASGHCDGGCESRSTFIIVVDDDMMLRNLLVAMIMIVVNGVVGVDR